MIIKIPKSSTLLEAYNLLSKSEKKKVLMFVVIQTILSFLDLFGVVIVGALGALSVQGIEVGHAGNKVRTLLTLFKIQNFSFQSQVAILGVIAASVLITKTVASMYLTRKVFYFLADKGAHLSADLISRVLSLNLTDLQSRNSQEILFITSIGVKNIMIGILATSINVISDISILLVISTGLFFIDPGVAFIAISLFALVGLCLHLLLQVRARNIGVEEYKLSVKSNKKILEVLNSYRESIVRNRRKFYSNEIRKTRMGLGKLSAELNFQPYISKYVLESASVVGALTLAAYEFGTKNSTYAVSILAVFLAASSRIAPAALRIQQSILVIKNSSGASEGTFELIRELSFVSASPNNELEDVAFSYPNFVSEVKLSNVSFKYSTSSSFALVDINLEIPAGSIIAIVGPSGAGKSTLIDLILGILDPAEGKIEISGVSPKVASEMWSGAISYIPQSVSVIEGTIRENVGLGYPLKAATDQRVWEVLKRSQLSQVVMSLKDSLDSNVGEGGANLSGGQRQRLGIARGLFTEPKLLVLDEATSALDGITELDVSNAIQELAGGVTIIIVAHRLSTVRTADFIVYMEDGKVVDVGSFDEVRARVPNFDKQANLMGI